MKKLTISLIVLLALPVTVLAQWDIETGVNQGYEWNIFKNPELVVENRDTLRRNRLWQNSTFNELTADVRYEFDWENSRLRIESDLSTNLYYQATEAHKFSYDVGASYRSNFADGKYVELSPEYSRKKQDGVEATDPVFSSRLSYSELRVPLELDFYLGNLAWLRFETMYRNRRYDRRNSKQTSYNAYYFEALFKQSIDNRGRFDHEFEIENRTRYRSQVTKDFEDQGAFQGEDFRQFTKIETEALYRLQNRRDLFEIEFPVQGTLFFDHPSSNLNYREIEFGTQIDLMIGNADVSFGLDRTLRHFNNFGVGTANKKLFYAYWSGDAEVEFELSRNIFLNVKASYTSRTSTRERLTTAFYREYTNSYIQSGIRVNLR